MPFAPIETEHLRLRRFRPTDWEGVYAYASDEATNYYLGVGAMTEEETRAWVDKQRGDEWTALAVVLKSDDVPIGHLVFHPWYAHRTNEIGWAFHERFRGRGYATEAARALLRHAFETLELHRMIATCQPENIASWRVMEKLGMRREAHFRRCINREDGTWWDEYFYAMLEEEWNAASGE